MTGRVCSCCGAEEGGDPTGGEVDPESGLCVTCQPCPRCGLIDPPPDSDCPERYWH